MEGTVPINLINMEGTRPLTGPALPNLINAVSILKSTSTPTRFFIAAFSSDRPRSPVSTGCGFDFNILTAFIRLGRARPEGAGCPPKM